MKNILFTSLFLVLLLSSCQKENAPQVETLDNQEEKYVEQTPIKELTIYDASGENYIVLDIYSEEFRDFTEENFTIRFEEIHDELPESSNDPLENVRSRRECIKSFRLFHKRSLCQRELRKTNKSER